MRPYRKKIAAAMAFLLVSVLAAVNAEAGGTPAGTVISNQATAHYSVGTTSYTATSNLNSIKVDELVNNTMTWQDVLPGVSVTPGQNNSVLTMRLANTGNATDTYTLAAVSSSGSGTGFTPASATIYLDSNGNGLYDAGDQLYVPGTNDPALMQDQSATVFIVSSIPSSGLVDGQQGLVQLTATSKTGTGVPGTVLPGAGPGGSAVVIGTSGGKSSASGTYVVSSIAVTVNKTLTVADQQGGSRPMTGSTIHYTLSVTAAGSGTAMNVVIKDPLPANTTYVPGTLKLNGMALTDAADADAGDVNATTPGAVSVRLPDFTKSSPAQTIMFDVKIN